MVQTTLPSLEQSLDELHATERRFSVDTRIAQTKRALDANAAFAADRSRIDAYYEYLGTQGMFLPIYGLGNNPNGLPLALPTYLVLILEASARVLLALMREHVRKGGPQYLIDKMPAGWLGDEMAERLHRYYLTTEPDLAFDVLVHGANSTRATDFETYRRSGDPLHAKLLEAQSVDTYYGWGRHYVRASRIAGCTDGCHFTLDFGPDGARLTDEALDRQTFLALDHPCEDEPGAIHILEVEPEKQATNQNLRMMAEGMGRGTVATSPVILDPRDVEIRDGRVYVTKPGLEREIRKVVSRLVDVDLQAYRAAREAEGRGDVVERLRRIYNLPHLWGDPAKHLMGFYYVTKATLTELSLLGSVSVAPRTGPIGPERLAEFRRNPGLLQQIAIKPLYGMSAKGVVVGPTLEEVETAVAREQMLEQELLWATPVMPDINPEIADPDVRAGVCSEARLVLHGGCPAIAHNPHRARSLLGLSRTHFQSADPKRRIPNDPKGRGWYSNVGAIMAVKGELGLSVKNDAGVGMAPIYWQD